MARQTGRWLGKGAASGRALPFNPLKGAALKTTPTKLRFAGDPGRTPPKGPGPFGNPVMRYRCAASRGNGLGRGIRCAVSRGKEWAVVLA